MQTEQEESDYEPDEYGAAIELLLSLGIEPDSEKVKAIIEAANGKYDMKMAFDAANRKYLMLNLNLVKDAIDILKLGGKEASIGKVKIVLNIADVRVDKDLIRATLALYKDEIEKNSEESLEELNELSRELKKELQDKIAKTEDSETRKGLELIANEPEVDKESLMRMLVIKLAYDTGDISMERVEKMMRSLGINISKEEIEMALESQSLFNKSEALRYSIEILEMLGQKPSVESVLGLVRAAGMRPDDEFIDMAKTTFDETQEQNREEEGAENLNNH